MVIKFLELNKNIDIDNQKTKVKKLKKFNDKKIKIIYNSITL